MIIGFLLGILFVVAGLVILFGSYRTYKTRQSPNQKIFENGKVPTKMDGLYHGKVTGYKTNWQGKKFDATRSAGINVFKNGDKLNERYPFRTYIRKGVADNMEVLKIDYSENTFPWWLRFILDELVEIEPGKYLGKVHITVIPGIPFTVGYFTLVK